MPRGGGDTREKILDSAQTLILGQGFAATSLDQILERTGVTKGAFFYHFRNKADLARALVERYARSEEALMRDLLERAERLSRDPLQQILIYLGLFQELFEGLAEPPDGCLLASYCYENQMFDAEVRSLCAGSMRDWRRLLGEKFSQVLALHPPRMPVEPEGLADAALTAIEGAFIVSRTVGEAAVVTDMLRHYRNYIELLFSPA